MNNEISSKFYHISYFFLHLLKRFSFVQLTYVVIEQVEHEIVKFKYNSFSLFNLNDAKSDRKCIKLFAYFDYYQISVKIMTYQIDIQNIIHHNLFL